MTEQEASQKRCIGPENCGDYGNPDATGTRHRWCIGSACMAWRWENDDSYDRRFMEWEDAANIGGITNRGPEPVRGGFCGLAGRP